MEKDLENLGDDQGVTAMREQIAVERTRIAEIEQNLEAVGKRLDNVDFVSRAPAAVVEQARARKRELQEKRDKLSKLIEAMAEA